MEKTPEEIKAEQEAAEAAAAEAGKTKTAEEYEAEAKALEEENKKLKEEQEKGEILENQKRRLEKAREKNALLKGEKVETVTGDKIETRDLITLGKLDLAEDSEKALVLEKYKKAGLINSYSEGLENIAVKAEFDAIDAKNNATTVIDENDSDETVQKTKKEVVNSYKKSGKVPEDPKMRKAIAENNLAEMGL